MKATIVVCVAASIIACSGLSAVAEVVTFQRVNEWTAFGGRSDNDRKVCGMSTSGGGRWFGVKYFDGDPHLTIHLSKNTWVARDDSQIDITMQFDNEAPWRAIATTFHTANGDAMLQFTIGSYQMRQWISEFRASYALYIGFPGNNVENWQADLSGTQEIADAMTYCLRVMGY